MGHPRRRFENGQFGMSTKRFLGYDTGENGCSIDSLSKKRAKNQGEIQQFFIVIKVTFVYEYIMKGWKIFSECWWINIKNKNIS